MLKLGRVGTSVSFQFPLLHVAPAAAFLLQVKVVMPYTNQPDKI